MSARDRPTNRQRPWEPGNETGPESFGAWLRGQREIRRIALADIADVTKISSRYLEALEQDRFDVLPAPVFAKGFLREYARYVGLDPDEVVNSYLTAQQAAEPEEEAQEWSGERKASLEWTSGLVLAVLVVALLGLVAFLAFYAERNRERGRREQPEPLPPIAAPPAVAVPEPVLVEELEPEARVPLLVTMDFTEDCWVEAVVDGTRRLSELHVQGESMQVEAQQSVSLRLGNPAGVHVEVNGRLLATDDGPQGRPRDLEIDLETARALEGGEGE